MSDHDPNGVPAVQTAPVPPAQPDHVVTAGKEATDSLVADMAALHAKMDDLLARMEAKSVTVPAEPKPDENFTQSMYDGFMKEMSSLHQKVDSIVTKFHTQPPTPPAA